MLYTNDEGMNIKTHIIPHRPDDVSQEPKRYSVDFASQ